MSLVLLASSSLSDERVSREARGASAPGQSSGERVGPAEAPAWELLFVDPVDKAVPLCGLEHDGESREGRVVGRDGGRGEEGEGGEAEVGERHPAPQGEVKG